MGGKEGFGDLMHVWEKMDLEKSVDGGKELWCDDVNICSKISKEGGELWHRLFVPVSNHSLLMNHSTEPAHGLEASLNFPLVKSNEESVGATLGAKLIIDTISTVIINNVYNSLIQWVIKKKGPLYLHHIPPHFRFDLGWGLSLVCNTWWYAKLPGYM